MRISSRGEYGVRAMFDLAQRYGEGPIPLKLIAERQEISEHYLEQLMGALRKAELVVSVRGAQGGYELSRPPASITLGDVIRALEGPVLTVHGTEGEKEVEIPADAVERLILADVWKRLAERVNEALDSVTLADLCDEAARRRARDDSFMYHI
ncbi:MAG: Rrf2 family transcriptional regulator [Clostridia bacterium]|nr:Rrf2 family transcriptional regulator [Bacillota bacterium]MBO2520659.1 Rrf2 family transcriptional regulator [Bacillota bacterium]